MKFIQIIFSLMLLASSSGWAVSQALADYNKKVGLVEYSLENLKNTMVTQDLEALHAPATNGLGYEIAAQIAERFQAGSELLVLIIKDETLSKEEKRPLVEKLVYRLMDLAIATNRQHGDDDLKIAVTQKERLKRLARVTAREFIGTFTLLYRRIPGAKPITLDEARDIALRREKGEGAAVDAEIEAEAKRNPYKVWKLKDRMVRDILSQHLGIILQKTVAEIKSIEGKADDFYYTNMVMKPEFANEKGELGAVERILLIRKNRQTAHRIILALTATLAGLWWHFPYEGVGHLINSYDFATAKLSDIIAFSGLGAMAALKIATAAQKTVPVYERLKEMVENPEKADANLVSRIKAPLITILARIQSKLNQARLQVYEGGVRPPGFLDDVIDSKIKVPGSNLSSDRTSVGMGLTCAQSF